MKQIMNILTHMVLWASVVLLFWTFYDNRGQMVLYVILTALVAGVCSQVRSKVKKLSFFLIVHTGAIAIAVCGTIASLIPLWYAFPLVAIFLHSVLVRCVPTTQDFDEPNYLYVGVAAAIYVVIWLLEGDALAEGMGLVFAILLFLICRFYRNIFAAEWFVKVRNLEKDEHARKACRFSKKISTLYTGAIGVILGLCAFISMDGVWKAIKTGVKRLVLYLISLIPEAEAVPEQQKVEEIGKPLLQLEEIVQDTTKAPSYTEVFDKAAPIVTILIILVLIIMAVTTIAMLMYRGFYQKRIQEDETLFVEKLKVEDQVERKKRKAVLKQMESTPAKQIRKIYKKRMNQLGVKVLRDFSTMTPNEQTAKRADVLREPDQAEEICHIYEQARYGTGKVTEQEVERIKQLM